MKRLLIALVRAYRLLLSPWLGSACRFEPTCSRYAIEALERHGALGGSTLAGWRLLRCHPWCDGGLDPVPDNPPWSRRRGDPSASAGGASNKRSDPAGPFGPGTRTGLFTRLVDAGEPPSADPRG
jgi:putative membrane protein insertion efficiency factor